MRLHEFVRLFAKESTRCDVGQRSSTGVHGRPTPNYAWGALLPGPLPAGGPVVPGPPFEIGAPPFQVRPTGCCIHAILYFKNVTPLPVFGPHAATSWRRA